MKRSKKKSGSGEPLYQRAAKALKGIIGLAVVSCLAGLTIFAFDWARSTDQFDLVQIQLSGNSYLKEKEIFEWLNLPRYPTLRDLDLKAIQEKLESHPYVRACRASRDFPSTLKISVIERHPIAYINRSPFHLVDEEGVVLPVRDQSFEYDVPTLSGFNPAPELYPVGEKCLSRKVLEAVGYLRLMSREFPSLYDDLSEVMIDTEDEYVLFLSQYPTKIYLGSAELSRQLGLLRQFALTIRGLRSLHDYQYVDLRYAKQIVVRERT